MVLKYFAFSVIVIRQLHFKKKNSSGRSLVGSKSNLGLFYSSVLITFHDLLYNVHKISSNTAVLTIINVPVDYIVCDVMILISLCRPFDLSTRSRIHERGGGGGGVKRGFG
jgi:hypothetical protein